MNVIRGRFPAQADALQEALAPSITIATTRVTAEMLPSGASRFGGSPDLPRGVAWPQEGQRALSFVGQIALAELARYDGAGALPDRGWLSFFFDSKGDCGPRVLHFDESIGRLSRDTTDGRRRRAHWRPCELTLDQGWTLPDDGPDIPIDEYSGLLERLRGRVETRRIGHQLLGYCAEAASEMAAECADMGGDGQWRLLLQVDSDDAPGWDWGDGCALYFWIRQTDLADARFDNVWAVVK